MPVERQSPGAWLRVAKLPKNPNPRRAVPSEAAAHHAPQFHFTHMDSLSLGSP